MASRFEEVYRFNADDVLTDEELNKRFKDLDDRLSRAEVARLSEDEAFGVVLDRVLGRSEAVIASLRDQLLEITQLQWLTASSDTPQTLAVEAQFALSIIEQDRALFAPGPYALLSWTGGAPDDYAIVRTLGFDRNLGQWDVRVEAYVGAPGPWNDWQIAAVAGATLAQMALLQQGRGEFLGLQAARDQAVAAKDTAVAAKDTAVQARGGAEQARDLALGYRDAAEDFKDAAQAAAAAAQENADAVNPGLLAPKASPALTGTTSVEAFSVAALVAPALGGDVDNWNPDGLAAASIVQLSADTAARTIWGLAGGAPGRLLWLFNFTGWPVTLKHGGQAGTAPANRFLVGGVDLVVSSGRGVALVYDGTNAAWLATTEMAATAALLRAGVDAAAFASPAAIAAALAEVPLFQNAGTIVSGSAAGVALDHQAFINGALQLTANAVLPNLTNPILRTGRIRIIQGSVTPFTLSFGSNWKPHNGAQAAITTALTQNCFIDFEVVTPTYIRYTVTNMG